jgi:DNA-binding NarL/FixJ family response regulator
MTAALLAIPKCEACLLLIELALPDGCGIWCARKLLAHEPTIHVILVSAIRDALLLERAAAVGIEDLLVKPFTLGRCLARMRFVLCRSFCGLWPEAAGQEAFRPLTASPQHPLPCALRDVEKTVLDCLAEGLMYKEIADRVGRSEAAVKKLANGIYGKLQVHSRTQAVLRWRASAGGEARPHGNSR